MKKNLLLLFGSLITLFLFIEITYRIFDPFPYVPWWKDNHTEHGNLSQYEETLGWKGIPNAREKFVTRNNEVLLQHNRLGFRDVDHQELTGGREAIVFLGDSFTWGYEVNFGEMFVNILREKLPQYEIFNLSHRGYGTDQSLLTFMQWNRPGAIKLVILMFSENDFDDNNSSYRYFKHKPKYVLQDERLVLTNVPVPKDKGWQQRKSLKNQVPSLKIRSKYLPAKSHFIHDVGIRIKSFIRKNRQSANWILEPKEPKLGKREYELTKRLVRELRGVVSKRGGELVVVAIPSKRQFISNYSYTPYQIEVEKICKNLNIDYLDLAPYFRNALLRTYYRKGGHWNKHGNKVVAKALEEYLRKVHKLKKTYF
jgi:lysophospholipase L1-like esterase